MGAVDIKTKQYVSRPEVFADLFNHLMYDGEAILKPEDLSPLDTTEIALPYGAETETLPVQKYRDVLKSAVVMQDDKAAYLLILGAENQTMVHYAMPVKNMVYDALNYASQVTKTSRVHRQNKDAGTKEEYLSGLHKGDRLTPVVTLVVYFGQRVWDGPVSLHEMLSTQDKGILKYVPDYRINLITPVSMSDEEIDKFRTDFKELATFIKCGKDKNAMAELVQNNEKFQHMDPLTAEVANAVTRSNLKLVPNAKGEVKMCVAITGIREDGRNEGRAEGRNEGRSEGLLEGKAMVLALMNKLLAAGRFEDAQKASSDNEYCNKLLAEFGLA